MKHVLVRNGRIVQANEDYIGSIIIEDSKISQIVRNEAQVQGEFDEVIDASKMIVIPGLINSHIHSYGNIVRGLIPAYSLEAWMLYVTALGRLMSEEDCYWNALLGAIDMIKSGTTCYVDHLAQPLGGLDAAMQACKQIGIRCIMAPMIADTNYFTSLALDPGLVPEEYYQEQTQSAQSLIERTETLLKKWHDPNGKLQVGFGPSGPQRCSDKLLRTCSEKAKEYNAIVHTHVLETKWQAESARRIYGEDMVKHLHKIGVLNENFSFAHGVAITDDEIKLAADAGSWLVHNPSANFVLGSGTAPVDRYLQFGANVALGTDGANGSGTLNMFETIKQAAMIHNITDLTQNRMDKWITPSKALHMATEMGAKACGLNAITGRIEEGYSADLVLIDPMRSPRMAVPNDVYWQLAYTNPEECVDTVLICGEVVMKNRQLTCINEEEVLKEAAKRAQSLQERFSGAELNKVLAQRKTVDDYFSTVK